MPPNLTLFFYDPSLGVDQHHFSTKVLMPTSLRLPVVPSELCELIRASAEPFHSDWPGIQILTEKGWYLNKISANPYGTPLNHIKAITLARILCQRAPTLEDYAPLVITGAPQRDFKEKRYWFGAIHAFVASLHPDTPVVLYWH